ncbi:hypothetical protein [Duganella callida]|uniref:Uncharacterized protein n=1 Tax=Duganella callida TaxID=2561932 RepID=A0A4Y9SGI2_9BURK|nr:hypothetical protein [Duganella callida]TFW20293.1 hypothetical protein E4L98_14960 [Duganella callida]
MKPSNGTIADKPADLVQSPVAEDLLRRVLEHFKQDQQIAPVLLGCETRPVLASALSQLTAERLHGRSALLSPQLAARRIAAAQLVLLDAWTAGRPAMTIDTAMAGLAATTWALVAA